MVRVLPPWFENLKNRQARAPKIYVRDTGLLHSLLGLAAADDWCGHPKVGASFKRFGIEQVLSCTGLRDTDFWATHAGAELDPMVTVGGRRYGFEAQTWRRARHDEVDANCVAGSWPRHIWVIHPGDEAYALDEQITAWPVCGVPDPDFS